MKLILFFLLLSLSSCYLITGFKTRSFTYGDAQNQHKLRLQVPRGFIREKTQLDSAGNKEQVYHYTNGMVFYIAYNPDSAKSSMSLEESNHIPLPHPQGGWIYKGVDAEGRFWREIRQDSLCFGYRYVPSVVEIKFDEALNYNSLQKEKRRE